MKIILLLITSLTLYANEMITSILDDGRVGHERLIYIENLTNIYHENNYTMLWNDPLKRQAIVEILHASETHGYLKEMFHIDALDSRIYESGEYEHDRALVETDILLSDALYRYIDAISYGILDPQDYFPIWNLPKKEVDVDLIFQKLTLQSAEETTSTLKALAPKHFFYNTSRDVLIKHLQLRNTIGEYPKITFSKTLRKGVDSPVVAKLRHRLYLTGDLEAENNGTLYDQEVESAVKRFQDRHGLKSDGILGKGSASFFNLTLQEQIERLSINLERSRWVLHHLEDEYVIVNTAADRLYYVKDNQIRFSTPVIVGKKMHETPIFTGTMRYIVYNPTWTVPHSIAVNELLHKAQNDSNYFEKKNLELLDYHGKIIDHKSLDFSKFNKHNFHYVFRQKAGEKNALGRIKFLFPNRQAIYLHDTPGRSLFSNDKREFSHGCVRVDKPYALSKEILSEQNMWNKKVATLETSLKTTQVNLKKPVNVLLMYWSAGADKNGDAFFYDDHYHLDTTLIEAMEKKVKEGKIYG